MSFFSSSYIELDREAFRRNFRFLRTRIGEGVRFCSVIKGNAYGHGIRKFVPMAEECGIRQFAVFSENEAHEALEVKTSPDTEIMIMGMISNRNLEWAVRNGISFFVFEQDRLKQAAEVARNLSEPARIHLHLETGMNRLGLGREDLPEVVRFLKENSRLFELEGVCTHYAGAESVSNHVRVTEQIRRFKEQSGQLEEEGLTFRYRHTASSASTLNYPETTMDMVRIGIAQYGFWPNRETYMNHARNHSLMSDDQPDPLSRVLSWKSVVMSTKEVEAGNFIGYGNTYLTSRKQTIATIPIGYAHGFGRNLTNAGLVLINGHRAQVAGLVNMNLITVDVTDIPDVTKGDEVVIIGKQGDDEVTVASFSEMTNHLNYEVLVRLPSFLPRIVV